MKIPEAVAVLEQGAATASRFPGYEDWPPRLRRLAARVRAGSIPVSAFDPPRRGSELTWSIGFWDEQARVDGGLQTLAQSAERMRPLSERAANYARTHAVPGKANVDPKDVKQGLVAGLSLIGGALGAVGLWWGLERRKKAQEAAQGAPAPVTQEPEAPPPAPTRAVPAAVVWTGPVNLKQVEGATIPGVPTFVQTCTGDGNPSCGALADGWRDADGRRLPGFRRALKLPEGPLVLAGFSAGGHLLRRLLADPRDRAEILAVYLADAMYTTTWKAARLAAPIEEVAQYAREAGQAGHLLVATASAAPNKSYPSGSLVLASTAKDAGAKPQAVKVTRGGAEELYRPEQSWSLPNAYFLDFGAKLSHEAHATRLARIMWEKYVNPFFGKGGAA